MLSSILQYECTGAHPKTHFYYEKNEIIEILPIHSDSLILSDMKLAYNVRSVIDSLKNDKEIIDKILIEPYPFQKVIQSQRLYLYFELSNLRLNNQSVSQYLIEYMIAPQKPQYGKNRFKNQKKSFSDRVERTVKSKQIQEFFLLLVKQSFF